MKRRTIIPTLVLVFSLVLAACGGRAQASGAAQGGPTGGGTQNGNGRGAFGNQDPNAPLPLASALAVGTIKLDTTSNAITADEAAQLIPLWEGLQSLMNSDTAAQAEVEGVVNQIQSTMTADQVHAIKAMNLKGSDEASVFGQRGFAFGGPNAQGTPRADVTPGANGGRGNFRGRFAGGNGGEFAFRGGGGFAGPGGPGGFNGGGLPGANNNGGGSGNSAGQSQRATAQARFSQFEQLGVNPLLVRVVINYLQGLSK